MKNNELRENVLNGTITPPNLAKMDVKVSLELLSGNGESTTKNSKTTNS